MTATTQTCQKSNGVESRFITNHLRKHWALWAWTTTLLLVNYPLVWGGVRSGLIFFPDAVSAGQWWRILTYPLIHLSWYHLLLDAGGFLILLMCLEEERRIAKALYLIGASTGALSLTLTIDPAVSQQGLSGLSGIAHGLMAISAMEMIRHNDQRRWGYLSLTIVAVKSAYELWSGQVLFDFLHMGLCGQPLAASHAGGVMGGLLTFILLHFRKNQSNQPALNATRHKVGRTLTPTWTHPLLCTMVRALSRIMYRVRYEGLEHIPGHGPAVLVCNHVSYVDWLIITSACNRPVHFVMHAAIYQLPVLRWVCRLGRVIPIDSGKNNPTVLKQAFREIADTLQSGGLICIFPEGHLTRDGQIDRFQPGIEKIIQRNPVPVIPLALRGMWGSFFSHKGGPAMRGWPQNFWAKIELAAGHNILPHHATANHLRHAVQSLRGEVS